MLVWIVRPALSPQDVCLSKLLPEALPLLSPPHNVPPSVQLLLSELGWLDKAVAAYTIS